MTKQAVLASVAVASLLAVHASGQTVATGVPHAPVTEGASSWSSGDYSYDGAGNIVAIGADAYVYDSVGRLISGTAKGPTNRQDYSYDSYGNRLHADTTGKPCVGTGTCGGVVTVDWSTNRVDDHNAQYDAAGNLTRYDPKFDPANPSQSKPFQYVYDGSGMISSITAPDNVHFEYVYTVGDERLATNTNGGNWRFTVRGLDGKIIREVNAYVGSSGTTWLWDRDHVFRGAFLLSSISTSGTEQFHLDHLGTPRVVTDSSGGKTGDHAYYPFGEELDITPREAPEERLKFTGHERDAAGSGNLDYMHARYYAAAAGHFLTPDPILPVANAIPNPQRWNRYVYLADNPLNGTDPSGARIVQLGVHTDDEIAERQGQIVSELQRQDLTKEQRSALTDERETLTLEKEGNHLVGAMLADLGARGERNGLQLSDFKLSTDTAHDFQSLNPPAAFIADAVKKDAFTLSGMNKDKQFNGIYIRTGAGTLYNYASTDPDFVVYGGTALRHEQIHQNGNHSEKDAYTAQRQLLHQFRVGFQNDGTYLKLDQFLASQISKATY